MEEKKVESQLKRRYRKVREGVVISDKMDKTVVVVIRRQTLHPRYQKYIRLRTNVKVHDEKNECHVGDRVQIIETRPISKTKNWRVQKLLEKAIREGNQA